MLFCLNFCVPPGRLCWLVRKRAQTWSSDALLAALAPLLFLFLFLKPHALFRPRTSSQILRCLFGRPHGSVRSPDTSCCSAVSGRHRSWLDRRVARTAVAHRARPAARTRRPAAVSLLCGSACLSAPRATTRAPRPVVLDHANDSLY